jgi:hypothetical protein
LTLTFADRIVVLHDALDAARIPHGFGGAVALAYHVGDPRATRYIDVNISIPTARAQVVIRAMPSGIAVRPGAPATIRRDGQIRLWWDETIPVDLFFPRHRFHAEVARDTFCVPFLDTEIPIISATHLCVFKALFNRSRDWPDIEAMLRAGTIDIGAAARRVGDLLGADSDRYSRLTALIKRTPLEESDAAAPRVDWRSL